MLYACAAKFDVTENLEKFLFFGWTKQGLYWHKRFQIVGLLKAQSYNRQLDCSQQELLGIWE